MQGGLSRAMDPNLMAQPLGDPPTQLRPDLKGQRAAKTRAQEIAESCPALPAPGRGQLSCSDSPARHSTTPHSEPPGCQHVGREGDEAHTVLAGHRENGPRGKQASPHLPRDRSCLFAVGRECTRSRGRTAPCGAPGTQPAAWPAPGLPVPMGPHS